MLSHPRIDALDLRPPAPDPWDFPRFPRRVQVWIETGLVLSQESLALSLVAAQIAHMNGKLS